jgi:hypothetical protein
MSLSKYERKERLGFGKQKEIADELGDGYDEALVSLVMNDKAQARDQDKVKNVREAIARRIGLPVAEVFADDAAVNAAGSLT